MAFQSRNVDWGLGHCWRRAFYLYASQLVNPVLSSDWSVQTSPVRGCAGASSQCSSAFSGDINTAHRHQGVWQNHWRGCILTYLISTGTKTIEGNYFNIPGCLDSMERGTVDSDDGIVERWNSGMVEWWAGLAY